MPTTIKTRVGIVGAGPAGLMLSHLLAKSGIDNVAIDARPRQEIETTHRAGILEDGVVKAIVDSGVSDRVHSDGYEHHGIDLRFDRAGHRIDFTALVNASCWLYPQTDVFIDLANARDRDGGDVRFGVKDTKVSGVEGDSPLIRFVDADGTECEIQCEVVAGTDGSRSICRFLIPENQRVHYFKEYPFAWFGVLSESPFNAPELIYAHSDRGFALISQRTEKIQRLYFQCSTDEDVELWSNQQIWDELQARVDGDDGFELKQGPIFDAPCCGSAVSSPSRCVGVGWFWPVTPRTRSHQPVRRDSTWRSTTCVSCTSALSTHSVRGAAWMGSTPTARGPWTGSGIGELLVLDDPDAAHPGRQRQLRPQAATRRTRRGRIINSRQTYLAESYTGWPDQKLA